MKVKDAYGFQINIGDEVVFLEYLYHNKFPESYWDPNRVFHIFKVKDIVISNNYFCFLDCNDQVYIANCCILKKTFDFINKILDSYYKNMV